MMREWEISIPITLSLSLEWHVHRHSIVNPLPLRTVMSYPKAASLPPRIFIPQTDSRSHSCLTHARATHVYDINYDDVANSWSVTWKERLLAHFLGRKRGYRVVQLQEEVREEKRENGWRAAACNQENFYAFIYGTWGVTRARVTYLSLWFPLSWPHPRLCLRTLPSCICRCTRELIGTARSSRSSGWRTCDEASDLKLEVLSCYGIWCPLLSDDIFLWISAVFGACKVHGLTGHFMHEKGEQYQQLTNLRMARSAYSA